MFFSKQPSVDDEELLNGLRAQGSVKSKAEDRLFERYMYFIEEGSRKHNLSEDEAFDAYSDSVLAVLEDITSSVFKEASSLKTYLFRIFQNKCVDVVRKKTTKKNEANQGLPLLEKFFQLADGAKPVLQKLIDRSEIQLLKQKLASLGESCRQLLQLSAEGFGDKEIAVVMEFKSADVVKTSRLRCLKKLRALYETHQ